MNCCRAFACGFQPGLDQEHEHELQGCEDQREKHRGDEREFHRGASFAAAEQARQQLWRARIMTTIGGAVPE